jgi:hypothetical protein
VTENDHMPWDDPWRGVGVPDSGFWTEERVAKADDLVTDFLASSFDRVIRGELSAEERTVDRPVAESIPLVVVSNEHNEIEPIKYDNRHLTGVATDSAVRRARGSGQ